MELYLDSADINEIKEAFKLGFLTGLTTTPTFMHRHGITDVDGLIVELSNIVPTLQIEALGDNAHDIYNEAQRLLDLGLDKSKTVFKIPVSLEGVKACNKLRSNDLLVNIHLVYTLQQAYMAMQAGATYVCPLVGRLQDQGHNAITLVEECVYAVDHYNYDTKIMFSSVRNSEHIRNALKVGAHTITVPYTIMKKLTENNFTTVGTNQFFLDTKLMTVKIKDVVSDINPVVVEKTSTLDALVKLTEYGFGAITVIDANGILKGVFTDGDLRRLLQKGGQLPESLSDLTYNEPIVINKNELLVKANDIFRVKKVDNIVVVDDDKNPVGMLDIQDINY